MPAGDRPMGIVTPAEDRRKGSVTPAGDHAEGVVTPAATESGSTHRSVRDGPWRVDLTIRPGVPRIVPYRALAAAMRAALEAAGAPQPASIGLILSDDRELAVLNATHMGMAGPTDVLSFPLLAPEAFPAGRGRATASAFVLPPHRRIHLGDIVVSVERAREQALDGRGGHTGDVRWAPADELRLLVTHGTLHLCGWDHAEAAGEAAMRSLERRLIARG
jgi:probable rRNA maturation factor